MQRRCVRVRHTAFCFSRLFQARLREEGLREEATVLEGEYAGSLEPPQPREAEALVVFAGRHIPEKRVPAVVAGIARARARGLDVRGLIFGDGPERPAVLEAIAAHRLQDVVEAPGFVAGDVVDDALRRALCLLHPSSREGYGLVVVEASAHGTPAIVVEGPDNAAVELIEPGVNGVVAPSASADDLADALLAVSEAGLPAAGADVCVVRGERGAAVAGAVAGCGGGGLRAGRADTQVDDRRRGAVERATRKISTARRRCSSTRPPLIASPQTVTGAVSTGAAGWGSYPSC